MSLSARLLIPGDEDRVDKFLEPHTPFALYLRANVKNAGLLFEGRPYQADTFGVFKNDNLVGVLAHGWIGNLQIFAPDLSVIPALAEAWRSHLSKKPREICLFLGPRDQAERLLSLIGIEPSAMRQKGIQDDLFVLPLDKIEIPPLLEKQEIAVRYADKKDRDLLIDWKHDYNIETLGASLGQENRDKATDEIIRRTEKKDLFVLEDKGQPVSFCGAEIELPDWCGIGPVWTPLKKRNRGYGRAVTAGALLMLRDKGVKNAMLYAFRVDALKAYQALGFKRIGEWYFNFLTKPIDRL